MDLSNPQPDPVDPRWEEFYRDLHRHPELGFQEHRTAGLVAEQLRKLGAEVTTGVGGTGVLGVLRNGPGPTALLRADMDALPVTEETGLDYASTATGTTEDGRRVGVSHACGHDMHTTALLAAAERLTQSRDTWSGTVVLVHQPAEELGAGAQALVDDGLYDRVPKPDVVLGQHLAPLPAGVIAAHAGAAYAGSDSLRVVLHGRGAHGSMPQNSVDPVVMAAETVMRLQAVVAREVAATDVVVLTVGSLKAGDAANVIPNDAELLLNIRTYDSAVRSHVLAAVDRVVRGVAAGAGAPQEPEVTSIERFPVVVNDPTALGRTLDAFRGWLGADHVFDPGAGAGSEDVGILATAADAPLSYWLLGGADPSLFTTGRLDDPALRTIPSNHSPHYAPILEPTLALGTQALTLAVRTWLPAA